MKTDLVLTIGEYLALCCDVPRHVIPPGRNARHIPITAEGNIEPNDEAHGSGYDRCGSRDQAAPTIKHGQRARGQDFGNKEQR